jgi:hypothetical protein
MKHYTLFTFIFLLLSNFTFAQKQHNKSIFAKDSILNNNKTILLKSQILSDSNVFSEKNKALKSKGNILSFNDSNKCVKIESLKQSLDFIVSKKIIRTYKASDMFKYKSIKEVYNNENPDENQICFFSGIYQINGEKGNLYLVETKKLKGGIIKTLFTEDGFLLWMQLIDKGKWNYSSGNNQEILGKYGINKDALNDKNLRNVIKIQHFFNN